MTTIMKPGDLAEDILRPSGADFSFQPLDEMKADTSVTMLAYGGAGVGKTWFCATAGPRTLIVNIGNGLVTIQSPVVKKLYYQDGVPIVSTISEERDSTTGIFKIAEAFDNVCDVIDYALAKFPAHFDTIIVDDATALRTFAANKALEVQGADKKSKTLEKAKKYGTVLMAQQDFLGEMNLIEQFIAGTVDLAKKNEKHFILTAHERYIWKKLKDLQGKVIGEEIDRIRPAFTGKSFPDDVTAHFDLLWHFEAVNTGKGIVYRAHTSASRGIAAKSRYPELFKGVEVNPNFLKIVATIRAAAEKK